MEVRKVVSRVLLGVAMTVAVAVVVFVGVPWLTSPAPQPSSLSSDEIVEQVLGTQAEDGAETVEGMALRVEAPEHPVMGWVGSAAEKPEAQAEMEGQADAGELPAPLSADEVAAAMSEFVRVASAPGDEFDADDAESAGDVEAPAPVAPEVPAAGEPEVAAGEEPKAAPVDGAAVSGSAAEKPAAAAVEGEAVPAETTDDAPAVAEVATPSGGPREPRAHEAGQAGQSQAGLPPLPEGVVVPYSLRGVMGYRLPLVSRQEVPDQVVSGVLIPGHTTYVILRQGEWELTGLSAEEIEVLRQAAERAEAEALTQGADETESRGWRPFDVLRRRDRGGTR